jgi:hypothetical protein
MAGAGPAKPTILQFNADDATLTPTVLIPSWRKDWLPSFTEHSYRSFAADGVNGELILFQNIGNDYAEWTFQNKTGDWSFKGQIKWPWGIEYDPPRFVRLAYPNVLLDNRAVHFVGVSNIVEPNDEWRETKKALTGKKWDYVFRRLFYAWAPDIANQKFTNWIELANLDKTAGRINLGDTWLAPNGRLHVIWDEAVLDKRLQNKFFQDQEQRNQLKYAILYNGKVESSRELIISSENEPNLIPYLPRFHTTPDGELFVFFM